DAIDSFNILTPLSRCSSLAVLSLFKQLEQSPQFNHRVVPDIHTWSILIQCHSRQGNMSSAISLFHKIIDSGHHPTTQTLNDLLDGFCRIHDIHAAMLFYNDIIRKNSTNFVLNYHSYLILIDELCDCGETQIAVELLRHALQIDKEPKDGGFSLTCCFNSILFRLCKDRLLSKAYDLCSEMIHVNNIKPDGTTYVNLIYGHCIFSQFKQALALFRQAETSTYLYPTPHTLVTEQEVKSAKSAAALMIKGGVKPNAASYHSVIGRLYKGGSTSVVMNKIALKVEELVLAEHYHLI
ncbi:pentatricopeptide repeat-containing protein, partial [Trifolium pratense]